MPDWSDAAHQRDGWVALLNWRHWLVHASATRPDVFADGRTEEARQRDYRKLPKGWAVGVVAEHACRLNDAAQTTLPSSLASLHDWRAAAIHLHG